MQGRIKFASDRGYGFITLDHALAQDVFFLWDPLKPPLRRGDEVTFWLDDDPRREGEWIGVDVEPV